MIMMDEVDVLKARKIITMMFGYLFENKKKIEDRKKKQERQTKKRDGNSLTSFLFSLSTTSLASSSEKNDS